MKGILITLMLLMLVGCASSLQKCVADLPSKPSQMEVLAQAKADAETKTFKEWWEVEKVQFIEFLSVQTKAPTTVTTEEIVFLNNFQFAIVRVSVSAPIENGRATMYLIMTRPDNEWRVVNVIVRPPSAEK